MGYKRFRYVSVEAYEVDAAIAESKALDMDNVDEMLTKVEADKAAEEEKVPDGDAAVVDEQTAEPTSDPTEADETSQEIASNSKALEAIFKDIDHGKNSVRSLESIAQIIENSEELGGITPGTLPVIKVALNSIYSQVGINNHLLMKVSTESLNSIRNRITVARESIQDIINKIIEIWNLIIAKIKQAYKFVKDLFVQRDKKAEQTKEKVEKLKKIYDAASATMDKPKSVEITGPLFTSLVASPSFNTFTDIEKIGNFTLTTIESFIKEIGTSIHVSAKNTAQVKSILFSLTGNYLELIDTGEIKAKEDEVKKILQDDPITKKPSITPLTNSAISTEFTASSKALAGGVEYGYVGIPTPWEISDLHKIKLVMVENTSMKPVNEVKIPDAKEIPNLLALLDKATAVQQSMVALNKELVDSFDKFLKYAEEVQGHLNKMSKLSSSSASEAGLKKTTFKQVETYRAVTETINSFYLKSCLMTDKYLSRYTSHLLSYAEHSFKEYL